VARTLSLAFSNAWRPMRAWERSAIDYETSGVNTRKRLLCKGQQPGEFIFRCPPVVCAALRPPATICNAFGVN